VSALEALVLPQGLAEHGRPWRRPGARGRIYGPDAPELEAAVPRWLAELRVPEGEVLKAPDVFRVGALVVKFFRQPSLLGWVRAPRAVRSAERTFWCRPLAAPRPWLAAGRALGRPSVLVREHVEGVLLREAWGRDERAEGALAEFLAAMERHGVVHGDLHPRNLLWNGTEWVLLDVDGLRHGLHDPRRGWIGQWARLVVHLGSEERVRALHARVVARLEGRSRVDWDDVRARVEQLVARRGGLPPR